MTMLNEMTVMQIEAICDKYAAEKTPLVMILNDIQNSFGYIPEEAQEIVSRKTGIPMANIYGVVTFYSSFSLKPKGKYVIEYCKGTSCYMKGMQQIVDQICSILNISPGETTQDGLFTIDGMHCNGACAAAPAVVINGRLYENLSVGDVAEIIAEYSQTA